MLLKKLFFYPSHPRCHSYWMASVQYGVTCEWRHSLLVLPQFITDFKMLTTQFLWFLSNIFYLILVCSRFWESNKKIQLYTYSILQLHRNRHLVLNLLTGSGKTFIAICLIKRFRQALQKPWGQGGKRTFFLVNTVPLVIQQVC